jgi:hypothetical protein
MVKNQYQNLCYYFVFSIESILKEFVHIKWMIGINKHWIHSGTWMWFISSRSTSWL